MKNLISSKYMHLLWQDELKDTFLLLKYGEVYERSKGVFRINSWSKKALCNLKKISPIFNEWQTDDGLYLADINEVNLPQVIEAWAPKKRFAKNSKWIKDKEDRLAHKIIPFKAILKGE